MKHLELVRTLVHLDLNSIGETTRLGDQSLAPLAGMSQLKWLSLSINQSLTDAALGHLAGLTNLEHLELHGLTNLTDRGLESLGELKRLRTVGLSGTGVTDKGVKQIVSQNPGLEEIWVENTDRLASRTLTPLREATRLKTLRISGDQLTTEGLAVLERLPVLDSLWLYVPFTDDEVSRLVKLPNLKNITLYYWKGGQPPPDAGYASLAKHPGLENLHIHGVSGSPTDTALLEFGKIPTLKTLQVSFQEVHEKRRYTTTWVAKFRELRPDVALHVDGTGYPAKAPPAAKPDAAANAPDPHRRAAEAIIKDGGQVDVYSAIGHAGGIKRIEDLPNVPFVLLTVSLNGPRVNDTTLQSMLGVNYLGGINVSNTGVSGREMRLLENLDLPYLDLTATRISNDSVALISQRKDLYSLSLIETQVTDDACVFLKQLPRLRSLNLGSTKVGDAGLKELPAVRSLRELRIPPACTAAGLTPLQTLPFLQHLDLRGLAIGDGVVDVLSKFKHLRYVNLSYTDVSNDAANKLQQALPGALIRHSAVLPSEGEQKAVRWALEQGAVVTGLDGEAVKEIAQAQQPRFGVYSVTFSPEGGPTSGAANIRGLRSIQSLVWADLKNADAEAEHIATLTSLTALIIGSDLSDKGLERLTPLKQLEELNLGTGARLTDDGARHLTEFKHLLRLILGRSPIGDAGLAHVGRLDGLQHLYLAGCPNLTSQGLAQLTKLPILRVLELQNTSLDDQAVPHLSKMASLRILALQGTKLTASGIDELKRALPKCAIFWDGGAVIPGAAPIAERK